jgi:2-amino-4-hydroxy-6-hydroxymethyldihydropteridine diphosphokinase
MNKALLLIGSNMGDRAGYLQNAARAIERDCGRLIQRSDLYETAAWGLQDQEAFLNQALELETSMGAEDLLPVLLSIETGLGRSRDKKYGPRTIDIDIIFYNHDVVRIDGLTIPHPEVQHRRFALVCLEAIAPFYVHPLLQKTVRQLLAECPDPLTVNKYN